MSLIIGPLDTGVTLELLFLSLVAFGVPALLFELSVRRARGANRGLRLATEVHEQFVRILWYPTAPASATIRGVRVVRECIGDGHRVAWSIEGGDQTAIDDWGIEPGASYRFLVEMSLEDRNGETGFIMSEALIEAVDGRC